MTDTFQLLEMPCSYYNANGVMFGYVVRMVGKDRTLFLNDINEIQSGIMMQTPAPNHKTRFYLTTALFKTENGAFFAAKKYYNRFGWEYGYELSTDGWKIRNGNFATPEGLKSKVMRFK